MLARASLSPARESPPHTMPPDDADALASSDVDDDPATEYEQYDARGRVALDASTKARARELKHALKSLDAVKPLRVVVDLHALRGLPRGLSLVECACELAPGRRSAASDHGFTAYDDGPVTYARERQRQRTMATARDGSPPGVVECKTSFAFYATPASTDDVVRVEVFEKAEKDRKGETLAIATCDVPLRALALGSPSMRWIATLPEAGRPERLGTFNYAVFFDHERGGVVHVRIWSAAGIKVSDVGGSSDPYVKCVLTRRNESLETKMAFENEAIEEGIIFELSPDSVQTKVKKKTLNPVWEEEFEFTRVDKKSDSYISFTLWDRDIVGEDDQLGQHVVHVRDIKAARPTDAGAAIKTVPWKQLTSKLECVGKINVVAFFEDDAKTDLRINVHRAVDLPIADKFGSSNTYVVATFPGEQGAEQLYQTAARSGTTEPLWDHWMKFAVPEKRSAKDAPDTMNREEFLTMRLYHFDEERGKSVFIGKAHLSLRRVKTKLAGGAKRSTWLPLVNKKTDANFIDIRMRAYIESEEPAARPPDGPQHVFAQRCYDSTFARAIRLVRDRHKSTVLHKTQSEFAFHDLLSKTIEARLRQFKWPDHLIPAYARAYAACCDSPELLPPPPEGMQIPTDIVRMFTAAAYSRVNR